MGTKLTAPLLAIEKASDETSGQNDVCGCHRRTSTSRERGVLTAVADALPEAVVTAMCSKAVVTAVCSKAVVTAVCSKAVVTAVRSKAVVTATMMPANACVRMRVFVLHSNSCAGWCLRKRLSPPRRHRSDCVSQPGGKQLLVKNAPAA